MKKIIRITLMFSVLFVSTNLTQAVFAQTFTSDYSSGVYTNDPTSGIYTSDLSAGVYTSDPTAGVYTSNTSGVYTSSPVSYSTNGVYTSDPTAGIYTSNPSSGIYTSDPTSGIYTSNPSGGVYTSDPTAGIYTSNPSGGVYTFDPTSGIYTSNPSGGVYTSDPAYGGIYTSPTYNYSPGYSYTGGSDSYTPSQAYITTNPYINNNTYGGYVAPTTVTTIPTSNTVVCSNGRAPINGSCSYTTTIPTTNTVVCSNRSVPINGSCSRTTTIPTTNTVVCSDGSAPINGSCSRVTTIPTTNTVVCSDGRLPVNGSCSYTTVVPTIHYQTCWDGAVIPTTSVCTSQYKICPNGTSVPVNQACYIPSTPIYVAPQVVKFNNVVTSVATEISKTSGRCNGIGLIANNAPSTGWFEYGETSNLGRTTATANIGQADTAPFSNVLVNLKPSTRYYCRAVMQNQYGLVKGEIVGFTTKATVVKYVKPVVVTKKPTTPVKTNTITCLDGSTVNTKSTSSATLINQGEKLVAVQVEKIDGNLISGEVVRYKITYKNLSDTRLSGVFVKVLLPQEIVFAGATAGNFDLTTRTLVLNQDTIDPRSEGVIMVTGNVQKDAPIGKTIITNVYVAYTVPGTHTQDEVTAYVVGSIMPNTAINAQDTGAKKVIGQGEVRGFMPNSLIEWLALLAILFIIFILGRSVYASYKDEDSHKH